ncbi:MAG: TonB-dependent receptor [Gemmatimonadaceae bacterium]
MRQVSLLRFVVVVAFTVAGSAGSTADAQPAPRRSVIDAVVTDTGLTPIPGVTVAVAGTHIRVATGTNGRFLIHGIPPGTIQLAILKLGYRSITSVVDLGESDTLRLAFTMENGRRQLEGVTVTERGRSTRLAEFDARREKGVGQFVTAEEIEKRNTPFPTELMRTVKGILIKAYPDFAGSLQYFAMNPRSGTRDAYFNAKKGVADQMVIGCPMEVYVDGLQMATPFNLDNLPAPSSIAGIEMYSGPATTPARYGGTDRRCGVILVWTKDGS